MTMAASVVPHRARTGAGPATSPPAVTVEAAPGGLQPSLVVSVRTRDPASGGAPAVRRATALGIMCSGRPVSVHSALVTGMTAPDARAAISAVLRAATGGPAAATGEPAAATGGPVTATGEPVTAIGKPVTAAGAQAGRAVNARDAGPMRDVANGRGAVAGPAPTGRGAPHGRVLAQPRNPVTTGRRDRKSTRLNSSHVEISYAVFCLKKKKKKKKTLYFKKTIKKRKKTKN